MTTPPGVPRIMVPDPAGPSYAKHLAQYGPLPPTRPEALLTEVAAAGLRGRGGGWFPTATKMSAVREEGGRFLNRPFVIANAMEGEPVIITDAWLMQNTPHLLLDGLELAVAMVGAKDAVVAVHEGSPQATSLAEAIAQRPATETVPGLVELPGHYVASEESALARAVAGAPGRPVHGVRPHRHGVDGRPTLVNNAETLAQLALIARFGAAWFRSVGAADAPGTVLVTVGGAVAAPGEYEVPVGVPVRQIIELAGGLTHEVTSALTGGFGGTWAPLSDILDQPWAPDPIRAVGADIGAGLLWLHRVDTCAVSEMARMAAYLAGESAGQCGVCVFGLSTIADDFRQLADVGVAGPSTERLDSVLAAVPRRGGCSLPDGAVRMLESGMRVFARDVAAHEAGGCAEPEPGHLPVPEPNPYPVIMPGKAFR